MMKATATAAERQYMGRVASLGCAVCRRIGFPGTPAQVHHPRIGVGAAQRGSHFNTIPLCEPHHLGPLGVHTLGKHGRFEATYGVTEAELIVETKQLVEQMYG